MKLNSLAVAVFAVTTSMGAYAGGTIGAGPLPIPSTWSVSGSLSGVGTILDTWNFTTAAASNAGATAGNTYVTISGLGVLNKITSFSAVLDGQTLTPLADFVTSLGDSNSITQQQLSIAPFALSAGAHSLVISGIVGAGGGSYSATLQLSPAAPVPEPETYAMMLAGLVAVGFLARRRG